MFSRPAETFFYHPIAMKIGCTTLAMGYCKITSNWLVNRWFMAMGLTHFGDWWTFWNLSTPCLSNITQLIENYLDKLMTLHHSEMPRRVTSWGSKKPHGRCEIRCGVDSDSRWGIVMRLFYEYSLTILWWWADSWDLAGGCDSSVWMRISLTINVSTGWANLGYAVKTKLLAARVRIFPSKK